MRRDTPTVAGFLAEHGAPVDEAQLVGALERHLCDRLPRTRSALLPAEAESFLFEHSGVAPGPRDEAVSTTSTTLALASEVEGSLSVAEAAATLGVDPSRVRHRLADGSLYSLRAGGLRRLPSWQFAGGRVLPGLEKVLRAMPPDLHPLSVAGFFSTPQPELVAGGDVLTPAQWLATGGDPQPVAELASSLAFLP